MSFLRVENLTLAFRAYGRTRRVLHDVSLSVDEGERVALIGQSGSGKTVTMRAIVGTLPTPPAVIEGGAIHYDGRSLLDLPRMERNRLKGTGISIVLQDPLASFNPVLTVGRQMDDVVRFADLRLGRSRGRAERRERMLETLRLVQLPQGEGVLDAYPSQLSGGMRQRVLIGMALLNGPRLLIADEPGTALDVTTQAEILALLNRLVAEEGLGLLLITHNLGVVREAADRVAVMERGRIVEQGTRRAMFEAPSHPYTRALMEAVPPLHGARVRDVPPSAAAPLIEVAEVSKTFERRTGLLGRGRTVTKAVDGVSLSVAAGEIHGVAGESGSGKTTLAKMMMGLIRPSAGSIRLDGRDAAGEAGTEGFRRLIQIVHQNPGSSLNPRRTVAQQLALPLRFTGHGSREIAARVPELLEMVDLPPGHASAYPHELSGGQKQRVAIARALSVRPRILVLDEPTSALDVLVQATVIDLLRRLRQELDLTYVLISHDLSLMRNVCSRVSVMLRGRIVEEGETARVFDAPEHPYTRALLAAVPVLSEEEAAMRPQVSREERQAVLADAVAP